ncbi:MAG: ABC transporter ATP-binding protein/permease [Bacteroidia bacterium]|jgi:ATP-binding cassette subfamily B protein|nr:ABC transporter ATP-binding protein/permease [Bacteroidia bacterium]
MDASNPKTTDNKKPYIDLALLKRIFSLAVPYKNKFLLAALLTLAIAAIGPLRPILVQYTIDEFISKKDGSGLLQMGILLLIMLIIQAGFQTWATILTNYLGQQVILDLRMNVYDYLTGLRMLFYDKTPVGTLVTRTVNDIETIADVFSEGLINISGDLLQIIFILGFMFSINWELSLISLSVLPFLLYAGYIFKEKVRVSFEDVRTQVAKLNTFVQEHIQGMLVVQLFNREQDEFKKFEQINQEHRDANIKSVMYYSVFFPVVELIAAVSTSLIVWYGAKEVLQQEASIGIITSFIMYINMFFRPIRQLADRFNTMQMGMVAADRIFKLIDDEQHLEPTGKEKSGDIKGEIVFENISFAYQQDHYVLQDINLHVKPGQTVALVGATGSGKSSIINLLSRFYEWQQGDIYIDGISIKEFDIKELRSKMAIVLQDVFLFNGTVMENIKLNNSSISDDTVIAAAKSLGAHEFIAQLPLGYQQPVQERGSSLSVGQRQLISFVRAMVTNPAILILDEATSSVDHETELIIQQAIEQMMKGRTAIVIAHRLSTIQFADDIIVLHNGKIIERGNHDNLITQQGYYKNLYELQFLQNEVKH